MPGLVGPVAGRIVVDVCAVKSLLDTKEQEPFYATGKGGTGGK